MELKFEFHLSLTKENVGMDLKFDFHLSLTKESGWMDSKFGFHLSLTKENGGMHRESRQEQDCRDTADGKTVS